MRRLTTSHPMPRRPRSLVAALHPLGLATALATLAAALPLPAAAQEAGGEHPGKPVYDKWCAGCHGVEGDGLGPAADWMLPQPRDFTDAQYQIRTTPSGALPTDADILRVIDEGMPGTAMPGWESRLSSRERNELVDYLKTFSRFFEMEDAPAPIEVSGAPRRSAEALEEGARLYREMECWKCHGDAGRGDGASAPTQSDDRDLPIRPADLTESWAFNGGGSLEAIYTRLRTGMDGTPMPSYADLVDAGVITDEQLWHLAMFVRSLAPEDAPEVRDVVRAALVEGPLPSLPSDEAWEAAERFWFPLVGQIIVKPRWFAPAVDGVWVQALHDGQELAMRLVWHEPSRSPDPAWEPWGRRLRQLMQPPDTAGDPVQGPDVFTVQFPATLEEGRDLPYFLGGDNRRPAYLWRWQSDAEGVSELLGRGLDRLQPLEPGQGPPTAAAEFEDGEWRLVIRRRLASDDPDRRLAIPVGEVVPLAFFAQDGSSGEVGNRGAVSSWYYLHLDRPVAATVYIVPILATLLTAALGLLVVARAQRAERRAPERETRTLLEGA